MRIRSRRRAWWLGLVAVVAIALPVLGFTLFGGSPDYFSVAEMLALPESLSGESITVRGEVVPGSISWDGGRKVLAFALADDDSRVDVIYQDIPPDEFSSGADLLVVGTYQAGGILQARHIRKPGTVCGVCH